MQIKSLELVNFRSFARTKLDLAQLTYVVGHNGAGKTTIVDAIAWGLTGRCSGLDGNNHEIAEMVRDGQTQGLGVRVDVDAFGLIQRQTDGRNVTLKVRDWTGSNKAQQTEFYTSLSTTEEIIAACLDTAAFLRLHHSDAKRLIMGVLNVTIPAADLEPLGIPGPLGLEELNAHYKRAFDRRTVAKRDLDNAAIAPAPEGEVPPTVEELQEELADVRGEYQCLLEEGAESRGRAKALAEEADRLAVETRELSARLQSGQDPHAELDQLEEQLVAHNEAEPEAEAPDGAEEVELTDDAAAQEQETGELRVKLADERGRLRMIAASVNGIEDHEPAKGCVLDSSIPCKTPAKEFTGKLKAIRQEITNLEKSIGASETRLQWLEAEARGRKQAEDSERAKERQARAAFDLTARTWRDQKSALERKIAAATRRISDRQTAEERLVVIQKRQASIARELEALGDVQEPAEAQQMRDRIARGERLIAEVRAWHEALARHDADLARTQHLRDEVERLENLCDKLGPKGLIVDAIESARTLFEQRVNRALEKWGYRLEFQIEPWTVRVNGRKSTQLSKSQRLRVGVALQLAIAEISGLWFVAIDEADMLDSRERAILQDVIEGWRGQVVVAATKDPGFELPAELPEGVAFYLLELREDVTHVSAA